MTNEENSEKFEIDLNFIDRHFEISVGYNPEDFSLNIIFFKDIRIQAGDSLTITADVLLAQLARGFSLSAWCELHALAIKKKGENGI